MKTLHSFALACIALAGPIVACENNNPDPNAPQNPTPNPAYPSATAAGTPTAQATTTGAQPTATQAATATTPQPQATVATTAQPQATVVAPPVTAAPAQTAMIPQLPAFPTFSLPPGLQLPDPTMLAKALPAIPLDPSLLNQIKQAGEQLMSQGMLTLGDPTDLGLKGAAVRYAPLMVPEGAAYKDTIAPGGHKAFDVTLAGNKCYTIIAYSPPGNVSNVDLHLLVPPFYNMDAGHDDSNENTAVIGKAPAPICPFTLIPIPYRVDVHARAGQGQVVVQVYAKGK